MASVFLEWMGLGGCDPHQNCDYDYDYDLNLTSIDKPPLVNDISPSKPGKLFHTTILVIVEKRIATSSISEITQNWQFQPIFVFLLR